MNLYNVFISLILLIVFSTKAFSCSILYFIDKQTGKIYFVNNEDYYYNVKPYIKIMPKSENSYGRIWYGWKKFGQGGINEKGLLIDGATTPNQNIPTGYSSPKSNITDEILAHCATIEEAINYLEIKKIALDNAHILLGDNKGNAVVVEWVNTQKNIVHIKNNRLIATNFCLSDTSSLNNQCFRYPIIETQLNNLIEQDKNITLKNLGNVMGKVVQTPRKDLSGKVGGTLYTTFIDVTDMKLVLVYKLDNSKVFKLDILTELKTSKPRKIKLK